MTDVARVEGEYGNSFTDEHGKFLTAGVPVDPPWLANEFGGGELTFPDGWHPEPPAFWGRLL